MIAESEKSYPTGMWVIFYRRLDDPNVWKTMRYQRNDGVIVSASTYDDVCLSFVDSKKHLILQED